MHYTEWRETANESYIIEWKPKKKLEHTQTPDRSRARGERNGRRDRDDSPLWFELYRLQILFCLQASWKHFAMGMAIAQGQYWNGVHGAAPGEALYDTEGMQQMRTLARNMVFLMRAIADGKEKYGLPKKERLSLMNFIR